MWYIYGLLCLCRLYNNNVNLFRKGCGIVFVQLTQGSRSIENTVYLLQKDTVIDLPKAAVCVPILPKINQKETQNNWYRGYSGAWIRLKKMQFPGGVPLRLPIARTVMLLLSFLQPVKPWGTFLTRKKADLSFNFFRLLKKWSILTNKTNRSL